MSNKLFIITILFSVCNNLVSIPSYNSSPVVSPNIFYSLMKNAGCVAVGLTLYPSIKDFASSYEIKKIRKEVETQKEAKTSFEFKKPAQSVQILLALASFCVISRIYQYITDTKTETINNQQEPVITTPTQVPSKPLVVELANQEPCIVVARKFRSGRSIRS